MEKEGGERKMERTIPWFGYRKKDVETLLNEHAKLKQLCQQQREELQKAHYACRELEEQVAVQKRMLEIFRESGRIPDKNK